MTKRIRSVDVEVEPITGPLCFDDEDAQKLLKEINDYLNTYDTVILDFRGVRVVTLPFACSLLLPFVEKYKDENLGGRIGYKGLSSGHILVLTCAAEHLIRYTTDSRYRKTYDSAMAKLAEEIGH